MPALWSGWLAHNISANYWGPAVYKFRILCRGDTVQLPRFFRADDEGLLLIGESGKMEDPRNMYSDAIEGWYGHPAVHGFRPTSR
jgi:hypothetical protein